LAIATDLFGRFKDEGLNNVAVAHDYRRKILEVAGSKPADEFIEEFLGRPFSIEAYIDLLSNL
jgi:thimet oligopeptidase